MTRLLRNLLFVYPHKSVNRLISEVESSVFDRIARRDTKDKLHIQAAEFMCLLNHPKDQKRNNASLGRMTSSLSSVDRMINKGRVNSVVVDNWSRIGRLSFSFQRWRFDAERGWDYVKGKGMKPVIPSLLERSGWKKISEKRETTHWINPVSYTHLTLPTICSV